MNSCSGKSKFFYFLSAALIILVYSNSFTASWHYDDEHNILSNYRIQINSLSLDSIVQCVSGFENNKASLLNRPVSFLSFGVNWFMGGKNVVGYHIVNVLIHVLNSFLLYHVGVVLIGTLRVFREDQNIVHMISALASILWAVHPIQTQAVTYIVQRMTLLSAFFYLFGIFFYLKAKKMINWEKVFYIICVCLCGILSAASKENGVLMIGTIFMIELVFYYDFYSEKKKFYFKIVSMVLILSSVIFFVDTYNSDFFSFANRNYDVRTRLLTQFRVLFIYLSQIIYPVSGRFSVAHGLVLSTSIFHPISTIVSICGVLALFVFAVVFRIKYKVIVFAVLFYLWNHVIESTIIPLEIIFEHRNYVPSMFVFFPISVAFIKYFYAEKKRYVKFTYAILCTLWIFLIGWSTYIRNMDWKDEESLWMSALPHAYNLARVHQNLSVAQITKGKIDLDTFLRINKNAEQLWDDTVNRAKYVSLTNIATAYKKKRDYPSAISAAIEVSKIDSTRYNYLRIAYLYMLDKKYDQAYGVLLRIRADVNLSDYHKDWYRMLIVYEAILNVKSEEYLLAFQNGKSLLPYIESTYDAYSTMAYALMCEGKYTKARHYLNLLEDIKPNSLKNQLFWAFFYGKQGNLKGLNQTKTNVVYNYSMSEVREFDNSLKYKVLPISDGYTLTNLLGLNPI